MVRLIGTYTAFSAVAFDARNSPGKCKYEVDSRSKN